MLVFKKELKKAQNPKAELNVAVEFAVVLSPMFSAKIKKEV